MKTHRDPIQDPDLFGVAISLFAIIVICAAVWVGTYIW
jgi:hypothetical protein